MKNHRQGGKFTGSHTTLIDVAEKLIDFIESRPDVSKISLSIIRSGEGSANGDRRVKILDTASKGLLLVFRQKTSVQEVRIFTSNLHETKLAISRAARNNDIAISYGREG